MASINIFRVNTPDQVTTFVVPGLKRAGVEKRFIIKNVGVGLFANPLRFNFDGSTTHYIVLAPGEQSQILKGIRGGELIYTDGVGGSSTVEIIIWED